MYNSEYVTKKHQKKEEKVEKQKQNEVRDEFLAGFQWHTYINENFREQAHLDFLGY